MNEHSIPPRPLQFPEGIEVLSRQIKEIDKKVERLLRLLDLLQPSEVETDLVGELIRLLTAIEQKVDAQAKPENQAQEIDRISAQLERVMQEQQSASRILRSMVRKLSLPID